MFYSHQLLARKAPLGQIWMAATMHGKINRKNLNKLNIIMICEEILNPPVPMALRLSSILMGGVVIVYERKVKLLFDDVSRLMVEINEAWKAKPAPSDTTVLSKKRNKAKFEAVTMPEALDTEEREQAMFFSEATARFQQHDFHMDQMQLDELGGDYVMNDVADSDHQRHQADPTNITLADDFGSFMAETDIYNCFERFDIDGDEEDARFNILLEEQHAPSMFMPSSPSPQEPPQHGDGLNIDPRMEERVANQEELHRSEVEIETPRDPKQAMQPKRNVRTKSNTLILDDEQLVIPASIYQSWLHDTSNIVRKRQPVKKISPMCPRKVAKLMELPFITPLENFRNEVCYPFPLMELRSECNKVDNNGRRAGEREEPTMQTSPQMFYPQEHHDYSVEDFQNDTGSDNLHASIEKLRTNIEMMDFQGRSDLLPKTRVATPGSSGHTAGTNPSNGSGQGFLPSDPEVRLTPNRSKRRQGSSSVNSFGNLETVDEEAPLLQRSREFKLRRLSERDPSPEFELQETGPTQTPHPRLAETSPSEEISKSIQTYFKKHFETPGAPEFESLAQLSDGMNRGRAAKLFYQICVHATTDCIKVNQVEAYGDILISKGPRL